MRPIKFPQATTELMRPASMTDEECSSLHIYQRGDETLSCWKPTWSERLAIFFGKPVWLWVWGHHHPPVAIEVQNPFRPSAYP